AIMFIEYDSSLSNKKKKQNETGRAIGAADAYIKVGCMEKALAMLKKSEALSKGKIEAYNRLLTQYATLGKKEAVLRNKMEKAVDAMKEAILISKPWWKPSDESLAACLKYLKGEGDIDEAEKT
ncbi:Tetratricopeptide-like helical, partial [Corchorus capsularis]